MAAPKKTARTKSKRPRRLPSSFCCAWPDRAGFWWAKHRWGMELMESVKHDDEDEDESEFAVVPHTGGSEDPDMLMPRDLAPNPRFVWLAESFPHDQDISARR